MLCVLVKFVLENKLKKNENGGLKKCFMHYIVDLYKLLHNHKTTSDTIQKKIEKRITTKIRNISTKSVCCD